MATPAGKTFTWDEVAQHNSVSAGVWVVIDGLVYDVTQFVDEHPGGDEVLLDNAGKDATSAFRDVGHSEDAVGLRDGFCIGRIASDDPPSEETPPSPTSR
jgi:cytochrome b involved in lipid metabolism